MFSTTGRRQHLATTEYIERDLGRGPFQTKAAFVSGPHEALLFNRPLTSITHPAVCFGTRQALNNVWIHLFTPHPSWLSRS